MFSVHTVKRICLWVAGALYCVEYNCQVKRTTNSRLRMVQLLSLSFFLNPMEFSNAVDGMQEQHRLLGSPDLK